MDAADWLCSLIVGIYQCLTVHDLPDEDGWCGAVHVYGVCFPRTPYNTTVHLPCLTVTDQQLQHDGGSAMIEWRCEGASGSWFPEGRPNAEACIRAGGDHDLTSSGDGDDVMRMTTTMRTQEEEELKIVAGDYLVYDTLTWIATLGHGISLFALVVAITLYVCMRRVLCTRVTIHINLMSSFLLRGLVWILHRPIQNKLIVEDGKQLDRWSNLSRAISGSFEEKDVEVVLARWNESCLPLLDSNKPDVVDHNKVWCHIHATLLNYFSIANYYWLLVEGVYLLLLLKSFACDKKRCLILFVMIGWALPALIISVYTLAQVNLPQNSACWSFGESKQQRYLWWIVKGPILLSLMGNLVIYVVVLRIVASKLKFSQETSRYHNSFQSNWRLAKSTLSLIPLLGIQYLVTGFVVNSNESSIYVKVVKYFEVVSTSVQGLLVSIIYCFCSTEVIEEIKKSLRIWRSHREVGCRRCNRPRASAASRPAKSLSVLRCASSLWSARGRQRHKTDDQPTVTVMNSLNDRSDDVIGAAVTLVIDGKLHLASASSSGKLRNDEKLLTTARTEVQLQG